MISRFLCFSKAYLCRGQSSPKRRWIVVASWRQLWRRPWRRRFGIVKRTLCVRVCVCCIMRLKVRHRGTAYGVFFLFCVHVILKEGAGEPPSTTRSLSLSLFFLFFFFEFFSPKSAKKSLSVLSLSLSFLFVVVHQQQKEQEQEQEQRHK